VVIVLVIIALVVIALVFGIAYVLARNGHVGHTANGMGGMTVAGLQR
jgi:hypothetical protein